MTVIALSPTGNARPSDPDRGGADLAEARETGAYGIVDAAPSTPVSSRVLTAWAAEQVTALESDSMAYPSIPRSIIGLLRAFVNPAWRKDAQQSVGTYRRPRTRATWNETNMFYGAAGRARTKAALVYLAILLLALISTSFNIIEQDTAAPVLGAMFGFFLLAGALVSNVCPTEDILHNLGAQYLELDDDNKTSANDDLDEQSALAQMTRRPQIQARFNALMAELNNAAHRSGVPLLRGDLRWAIRCAQRETNHDR